MAVIGLTALFFVAVLIDLPLLLRENKHRKKVISIYLFIIFTAYAIGFLLVLDIKLPSPTILIEKTIEILTG